MPVSTECEPSQERIHPPRGAVLMAWRIRPPSLDSRRIGSTKGDGRRSFTRKGAMTAPKEVKKLVERFRENREAYLSREYNETQLRRESLDPFFKALGWDVDNEQGYAEAYKDVVHEDAIKVGGATKAPDYAFRIGGTRKFFVEAKRPSVGIKDDPDAAYQLRRYAWSAKLPLSCRLRNPQTDERLGRMSKVGHSNRFRRQELVLQGGRGR